MYVNTHVLIRYSIEKTTHGEMKRKKSPIYSIYSDVAQNGVGQCGATVIFVLRTIPCVPLIESISRLLVNSGLLKNLRILIANLID